MSKNKLPSFAVIGEPDENNEEQAEETTETKILNNDTPL